MKNSDSCSSNANTPVVAADKAADTQAVGDPVIDVNLDQFSKTAVKNVNKMAKRTYVAESPIHGKGLFAAKDIKADVVLGRLHGMLTDKDGTYILWLNKRTGFEITNEFRFINHDSNPNCALTDTDVVTLRAIGKDEELTHDYGW